MRELIIFTGPVSAEKSTHAAQAADRLRRLGFHVVLIRPTRSVRPHERPGYLVTKNGTSFPSHELDSAAEIVEAAHGADVVWLDEPMLFPDDDEVFDAVQAVRRHATVIISGCAATSELEPFGSSMPRLIAVADEAKFLKADCDRCGSFGTATRSICLRAKTGQVLVGGADTYEATCAACWRAHVESLQEAAPQGVAAPSESSS